MKKVLTPIILLACIAASTIAAHGTFVPPTTFTYQGKLTDASGQPAPDGARSMTFKLFVTETGGTAVWTSAQSVSVGGGLFTVSLGPVPTEVFSGHPDSVWLETAIGTAVLSPRAKLSQAPSAGFAAAAGVALDVADHVVSISKLSASGSSSGQLLMSNGADVVWANMPGNLDADRLDGLHAGSFMRLDQSNVTMHGLSIGAALQLSVGQTGYGLAFPSGYGGDSGDAAWLRYYPSGRGATAMNLDLGIANDANDQLNLISAGGVFIPSGGLNITGDLTVSGTISGSVSVPDSSITSAKIADGAVGPSDLAASFADGSAYDGRFVNASGDTMNGNLTVSGSSNLYLNSSFLARFNNDGTYTNYWGPTPLRIQDAVAGFYNYAGKQYWGYSTRPQAIDYHVDGSNYLKLFYAGTQVGDISAADTSWLRLNANTTANILTPRMLRADGGLFVGGTTYGMNSSGNVISPQVDAGVFRDRDDTSYAVDPSGSSRVNNLTVTGTLTANINPGAFDGRYLLRTGNDQIFSGDLINTSGANYRNPLADNMGCISSQMFSSRYYYGPDSTSDLYIGESNPVYILGNVRTPMLYDNDNPAYYVNPAGRSIMSRVDADTLYDRADNAFYIDPSGTSILNDVRADRFSSRQDTAYYLDPDGVSYVSGIYANQIYVDSLRDRNDPANYYLDPASTSRLNNLTVIGALTIPTSSIASGNLSASGSTAGQVLTSNGTSVAWASPSAGDGSAYDSRFVNASGDTMSGSLTTSGSVTAAGFYDSANSAYYVDPVGISNVNSITVNGTINVPEGKPNLPIAYGYISSSGTKASGTANVTSSWDSFKTRYVITIAGETYVPSSYVTTVTVSGSASPLVAVTSSTTGGDLVVQIFNLSGTKVQADFQFVVHKP